MLSRTILRLVVFSFVGISVVGCSSTITKPAIPIILIETESQSIDINLNIEYYPMIKESPNVVGVHSRVNDTPTRVYSFETPTKDWLRDYITKSYSDNGFTIKDSSSTLAKVRIDLLVSKFFVESFAYGSVLTPMVNASAITEIEIKITHRVTGKIIQRRFVSIKPFDHKDNSFFLSGKMETMLLKSLHSSMNEALTETRNYLVSVGEL